MRSFWLNSPASATTEKPRLEKRSVLSRAAQVETGSMIAVEFADGEVSALASSDQPISAPKKQPRAKPGKTKEPGQGSLF